MGDIELAMGLFARMPRPMAGGMNGVAACSDERVIGFDGGLPWSIPADAALFRLLVRGGVLVQGRRCQERFGAPAGTDVVVVSSQRADTFGRATVVPTAAEALAAARTTGRPIWVGGGQRLYEEVWPLLDRLYLTVVHTVVVGDRWLPDWRERFPIELFRQDIHLPPHDCTVTVLSAYHDETNRTSVVR